MNYEMLKNKKLWLLVAVAVILWLVWKNWDQITAMWKPTATGAPTTTTTTKPAGTTTTPKPADVAPPKVDANKVLKRTEPMMRGEEVRQLQDGLNKELAFLQARKKPSGESEYPALDSIKPLAIDGNFGDGTLKVLKAVFGVEQITLSQAISKSQAFKAATQFYK